MIGYFLQIRNLSNWVPAAGLLFFAPDFSVENINIIGYDRQRQVSDYNRLRFDLGLEDTKREGLFGRLIVDNETGYQEQPASLHSRTSIYRAYIEYGAETSLLTVGRQRVPFGVGRLWNPVDCFNPIDSLSLEPAERQGTEALRYEKSLNDLSVFDVTVSRLKSAARIKGFLGSADVALLTVIDNDNHLDITGYELEGELADTGIELRSEGGSFHDRRSGNRYTELIVGAEYGFANSLNLLGEYKFNDETHLDYGGLTMSYQSSSLCTLSLLGIMNLDDHSTFISPSFEYSLSDEMTLSGSAFFYHGSANDEFGSADDFYSLRWFVHF